MSKALDEISKEFGFSNYKHYLNVSETNKQSKPAIEVLLRNIYSERNILKKIQLAITLLQTHQLPFYEQLDILKLFQQSHEFGLHPDFDWLDDVHFIGKKLSLVNGEVKQYLFNDFLTDDGVAEIHFRQPHFKAKEISLSELTYEIRGDMLIVDGQYNLKTEFEYGLDEDDLITIDDRFNDCELFGSFGVEIDRDKKITIMHSDIMEGDDRRFFGGSFR